MRSTDHTDITDIQITDNGTFYDLQITEVQMGWITDGSAMKCGVMDALLAKWTARLYFMDGSAVKCATRHVWGLK